MSLKDFLLCFIKFSAHLLGISLYPQKHHAWYPLRVIQIMKYRVVVVHQLESEMSNWSSNQVLTLNRRYHFKNSYRLSVCRYDTNNNFVFKWKASQEHKKKREFTHKRKRNKIPISGSRKWKCFPSENGFVYMLWLRERFNRSFFLPFLGLREKWHLNSINVYFNRWFGFTHIEQLNGLKIFNLGR